MHLLQVHLLWLLFLLAYCHVSSLTDASINSLQMICLSKANHLCLVTTIYFILFEFLAA